MQSKDSSSDEIFAEPLKVDDVADCYFYHTMELPGYGVMNGEWDLRRRVDEYLARVSFAGQRVLEIGPASGFLPFEMEKRGAEVVSIEVTPEWWHFSTQFFTQFLAVMGFTTTETLTHEQYHRGKAHTLFTVIARRKST